MLVQRRVAPASHLPVPHLYTWVERSTVTVKCFAQKHNKMSLTRADTRTTRFEDERANHETTSTHTCKKLPDHFIYYLQALNYTSVPVVAH